jgi:hypothetical protein
VVPEHIFKRGYQFRPQIGSYVYIIGLHNRTSKFLGNVIVFIGTSVRRDESELRPFELTEAIYREIDGFYGSCLVISTIGLQQGLNESFPAVYKIKAKFSFEAPLSFVDWRMSIWDSSNQPVSLIDFQIHLAADRAVWANG